MKSQEIYQQFYFAENSRQEFINNSLAIPLGIISAVTTAFVIVAKEIDKPFESYEEIQIGFLVLTAFCIFLASYFLVRTWIGYYYGHMPRANELRTYFKDLKSYYIEIGESEIDSTAKAEEETLEYVNDKYAEYAEMNSANNDKKSLYLFRANVTAVFSAILLVFASAPYIYNEVCDEEKPQKIEIINYKKIIDSVKSLKNESKPTQIEVTNIKELNMADEKPKQPSQPQNSNAQPQKPPPQKPNPPQGRVSLEHLDPKRK